MATPRVLYVDSNNLVVVDGLYNNDTEAYVNNATVEVTIQDTSGNDVAGETWPVAASYQTGSNGRYHAVIDTDLTITKGTRYQAKVEIKVSGTVVHTTYLEVTAVEDRRS